MTIRVTVTTSAGSLAGLEAQLASPPFRCERRPLLAFETTAPATALEEALQRLGTCDAVACTSPRAAEWLAAATTPPDLVPTVWVSGSRTASALAAAGHRVRVVEVVAAAGSAGEQVAAAILAAGGQGPVLHVTGDPHRPELASRCRAAGVAVEALVVYRSVPVATAALVAAIDRSDLVVIGSPTLAGALAGVPGGRNPGYVALGHATAAACRAAGLEATATARTATPAAVAEAILLAARTRALPLEG